ncbi:hypothetical protein ACS0TY_003236 [Phlomoides rotata]
MMNGVRDFRMQKYQMGTFTAQIIGPLKFNYSKAAAWAHENSGCIPKKIKQVSRQLEEILCSDEIDENSVEIHKLEVELEKLHSQEEMHWHQRSRTLPSSTGARLEDDPEIALRELWMIMVVGSRNKKILRASLGEISHIYINPITQWLKILTKF